MLMKRVVLVAGLVSVCLSSIPAAAADANDGKSGADPALSAELVSASVASDVLRLRAELPPEMKRPNLLPALYVGFGVVQAWDIYTTRAALKSGASEMNPIAAPFAGSTGKMIGLKAATGAATIFFTERLRKQNKVAAIAVMAGVNSGLAMIAARNARLARGN
jgi:hypothetical protein